MFSFQMDFSKNDFRAYGSIITVLITERQHFIVTGISAVDDKCHSPPVSRWQGALSELQVCTSYNSRTNYIMLMVDVVRSPQTSDK